MFLCVKKTVAVFQLKMTGKGIVERNIQNRKDTNEFYVDIGEAFNQLQFQMQMRALNNILMHLCSLLMNNSYSIHISAIMLN